MRKHSLLIVNQKRVNDLVGSVLAEIEKAAFEQGVAEGQRRARGRSLRNALTEARQKGFEQGKRAACGQQYRRTLIEAEERGFQRGLAKVGAASPILGRKSSCFDDFINEHFVMADGFRVSSTDLYREFCRWWQDDSSIPTVTAFGRLMAMRFKKCKSNGRILYQGLRMASGHGSGRINNSHIQQNDGENGTIRENVSGASS